MLRDMIQSYIKEEIEYSLCFDDGVFDGFGFPCDKDGNVKELTDDAKRNLEWCKQHPEQFERFNYIEKRKYRWREPASGICKCGERVELINQYMGACECPRCGQWYNLFGEELKHPRYWME